MIIAQSARKSFTPPAEEAYNEVGEEEKDKEEAEDITPPKKRKRTSSRAPKDNIKSKGKGKDKAGMPTPSSSLARFAPVVRKTPGKSNKDKLPVYVPP